MALGHTHPKYTLLEEIKLVKNNVKALKKELKNRNDKWKNVLRNKRKPVNTLIPQQSLVFPSNRAVPNNVMCPPSSQPLVLPTPTLQVQPLAFVLVFLNWMGWAI